MQPEQDDWTSLAIRASRHAAQDNTNKNYQKSIEGRSLALNLLDANAGQQRSSLYFLRAGDCYVLKQYDEVINDCTQAIAIRPAAHFFRLRGCAYAAIGRLYEAVQDIATAIDTAKDFIYDQAIRDHKQIRGTIKQGESDRNNTKIFINWPE